MLNDVRIEKWVYGGDALARHEGKVLLAPFLLPGETASLEVVEDRPGYARARLGELTARAPERVEAPCPHFTQCGGCQYQHAPYEFQVERKKEILREVLLRIGKLEAPAEIRAVDGPAWEYRNRIQLHFDGGRAGFHEAASTNVCAIERCPIASPALNRALESLGSIAGGRRFPAFLRSLELFTNEQDVQLNVMDSGTRRIARSFFDWCAEFMPGATRPTLDYPAAGFSFRVSRQSFFQVNRFLIDALVESALDGASGETALDLYAGVGLFSLPLTLRFQQVVAVESSPAAAADLMFNAGRAARRVETQQLAAEAWLAALDSAPDFVLADPPRAGLGKQTAAHLVRLRPPRLHIVSCDPATLARDLRPLLDAGYAIEEMTLVDLFPQTAHIETVVKLRL